MLCVFTRPLHFFAIFDRNNCNKEKEKEKEIESIWISFKHFNELKILGMIKRLVVTLLKRIYQKLKYLAIANDLQVYIKNYELK